MTKTKLLSLTSIIIGIGLLVAVFTPLLSYQLTSSRQFQRLLSPVPDKSTTSPQEAIDFTKASNWFQDGKYQNEFVSPNISYYTISIPKLRIQDASVAIGGENLAQSLIQYPGTALPGKRGNAVVFGHSILPQFFDPSNYTSIFSTLPTLNKNDEILVNYDGITYKYIVEDMFEVLPTDLQVLEQNRTDSFITLITCVPPGHPLRPKRLVVKGRIVDNTLAFNDSAAK